MEARIVVTLAAPARQAEPERAARRNALYLEAIRRHGGEPVPLDATSTAAERADALRSMNALLLSGGTDIDPARYGAAPSGATGMEPDRDELEAEAWAAAAARDLPVLGVCRGHQAINVFMGGTLLQHVDGHAGPPYGSGTPLSHPLRLEPGTRLARILFPTNVRGGVLAVNSFHHQAVRPADLAPGLAAAAWSPSPAGDLVEGFEATGDRFVVGVQCHPERTDSTPPAFERLWRVFVGAAAGAVATRR